MSARARLDALLASGAFGPLADDLQIIETHVSWVVLTGGLAYKLKKPVSLGFLDFSSLAARRQACEEELRLNRRLAPDIYLAVVELHCKPDAPLPEPAEPICEYAVKMRRFPTGAAVGGVLAATLTADEAAQLGTLIGTFHQSLLPAAPATAWGTASSVWQPVDSSLAQLAALLDATGQRSLADCRRFLDNEFLRLLDFIAQRRQDGAIRECHGDMHLGNLVRLDGRIVPFDALEFDPGLRWIDVMNEMAFLLMDLDVRGRRDLAFRILNSYLDVTGDFTGLAGLRLYLAYRALVRAKVGMLRPAQDSSDPGVGALLAYAATPLAGIMPGAIVMSGVSGSGKSWLAQQLAAMLPAIHIRSDVERKRMFGLTPLAHTGAAPQEGIYAADVSAQVYTRMAQLARTVLGAGLPVILDATALRPAERAALVAAAQQAALPTVLVACEADRDLLLQRVTRRAQEACDPSEAGPEVLELQLREYVRPAAGESRHCIIVDTTVQPDVAALAQSITSALAGCS